MPVENVKKFYDDIEKDEKLNEKVVKMREDFNLPENPSDDELISTVVSIAEKLGYQFSVDEFKEHISSIELSDNELELAAGGSWRSFAKGVGKVGKGIVRGTAIAGGVVVGGAAGAAAGALLIGGGTLGIGAGAGAVLGGGAGAVVGGAYVAEKI